MKSDNEGRIILDPLGWSGDVFDPETPQPVNSTNKHPVKAKLRKSKRKMQKKSRKASRK